MPRECIRCFVLDRPGEAKVDVLVSLTDALMDFKGYRDQRDARNRECCLPSI